MNPMIIFVRLRKFVFAQQQRIEPFALTQFKILVHLDRFKRTNLHANLAAHANRDIDVEDRRIKLRLAQVIGLLVVALNNIDALRRAFLLANLARHAAQARVLIFAIVKEKREIAIVLRSGSRSSGYCTVISRSLSK